MLAPARTIFNGRLAFLKKTRPWHSLKADEVCCDSPRSRSRGPSGVPAWRRQRAAQRHQRSSPLFLVDEPAGCSTRTKGKEMEAGRQAGRQAGKQQAGRGQSLALGDARGVCGIYPACEELLHVYPATQREALAAERGRWRMRRCVRHWKDAHPAASSVMATSATARSSANNRQPTPPLPPNSSSSNGERAEQGRAGTDEDDPSHSAVPFCQYFEKSQAKILKIAFCSKGLLL